jgi:hypothetical protein
MQWAVTVNSPEVHTKYLVLEEFTHYVMECTIAGRENPQQNNWYK